MISDSMNVCQLTPWWKSQQEMHNFSIFLREMKEPTHSVSVHEYDWGIHHSNWLEEVQWLIG